MEVKERVKSRKVIIYDFDGDGHERDVETTFEPVEQGPGEFDGDDLTQSLDHGQTPLEGGAWRIYKVYEKKVIWVRHGEATQ